MTTGRLETLGYAQAYAHEQIEAFLAHPRSYLVDIRYKPYSRWNTNWNRDALAKRYGRDYVHLPGLGNLNYAHKELPIQLADPERHISHLAQCLKRGYSYLLLCACKDYERCHRKVVYERILAVLDPMHEPEPVAVQACEPTPLVYATLSLWEGYDHAD